VVVPWSSCLPPAYIFPQPCNFANALSPRFRLLLPLTILHTIQLLGHVERTLPLPESFELLEQLEQPSPTSHLTVSTPSRMNLKLDFSIIRIGMYGLLALFSFLVLCLSGARLQYTTHLPRDDSFYDPIVVELLFTMVLTIPWCIFIIYSIHKRYETPYFSTFLGEIIGLSVLWLFWIVGAAIASTMWGDLGRCETCRILSALLAFSWLGWLVLSLLLGFSLLFSFANKGFMEPLHGRWNPRESRYPDTVIRV